MNLSKKYRPSQWSDVIAQDRAIAEIRQVADDGYGGKSWWISGKTGTGKTTIARLIAAEIADPISVDEFDGASLTMPRLRELERTNRFYGMGCKSGRAVIVNESHRIRADVVTALLVALEPGDVPEHVAWIFTTTNDGMDLFEGQLDAHPLLSRCERISLGQRDLAKPFAAWARDIAQREGLNGKPIEAYVKLVNQHRGNLRAVLGDIGRGVMKA